MVKSINVPRSTAFAMLLGMIAVTAVASPAAAHSYTRCDWDGDHCVRVNCDWDGDECWRQSEYYGQPYYNRSGRWACDSDGDSCRWVYDGYRRRDYDRQYGDYDEDWRY